VAYVLATPKPNGCRSSGKDFLCARNNSDYKLWTFAAGVDATPSLREKKCGEGAASTFAGP